MADVRLKELLAECEKRWPVTVNDKALADIKPETITNGGSTT
jgi:hypothetical protein